MTGRYKAYPEYKDSGVEWVNQIPTHWKFGQLSKLFEIKAGGDLKTEYFSPVLSESHPYPIYTNATDENAVYGYTSRAFYQGNSITVSGRGDVGYAIYRDKPFDAIIRLLILTPRSNICSKFFMYFIREVIDFQVESSAIGQLSTNQISPFKVVFPNFEEQQKIANFLDHETAKIDTLIAKQEKLIELLKEKRQAVISHAVTKGLNPDAPMKDSGVEWLGEVPEHWDVTKFGYISQVVRGGSPRPAGDPELFNGDYSPWVTVAEITKDDEIYLTETETFLTKKGSLQCRVFTAGTLLLSNSGATLGVPSILSINANANDGVVGFENLKVNSEFAYFYLSSLTQGLRDRIKQGSGQPNLNTDIVKGISIPLPPSDEIEKIVEYIHKLRAHYRQLESKAIHGITLLKERKTALISAAVTGKIDVRDWESK
ncbi:TPA: restriction endonuclease subunit S [Vibrio cholerae]|uniref:restriction endonuclease subunit S n=1 Tax=Vibrio cholerae TaxID=666 RepID=UPI0015CEF7AC|nr:restriction endonuclease subunit S [Vibrio cholerae]HDI3315579.1 restriction endonuclease subunit S [Vibrio cholerae]HDZ9156911.1 restriction endonuclease subunit S [Vibrio cholerae]HDZ9219512.1 restriction endonuclease subunit S [Vibrio cholerae]